MSITATDVRAWISDFAAAMAEHRAELVALDTAIGDGDHGTNMDRGMKAAVVKVEATEGDDVGAILKAVAMTLISKVGGAAGPLYGTLFLQMGTAAGGKTELDLAGWTAALEAGVKGVQARGKAEPEDKTMIDALLPAVDALKAAEGGGRVARRRAPPLGRRGRGGYEGDDPARGAQGPGQLPRPALGRPPGSGRDLVAAAAGDRRGALRLSQSSSSSTQSTVRATAFRHLR